MKLNKSIQKSWDKLESFFGNQLTRSSSNRPKSTNANESFSRCVTRSRSRFRNGSIISTPISGVTTSHLEQLYLAKCADLQITAQSDHKSKFLVFCSTHFLSKELKLLDFSLGPNSGRILAEILRKAKTLAYIKLGRNNLGYEGVNNLLKGIIYSSSIVHIDLSNNGLTPEACSLVLRILRCHNSIASLNLSSEVALNRNKIGKIGAGEVELYLKHNLVIGVLNFYGTFLKDAAQEISTGLKACKSLVSLNIGGNMFEPLDMKILVEAVLVSNLKILNLADNVIGNDGAIAISELLANDCIIEQLNLKNNSIGVKGGKSIFTSLYSNFHLMKLDLSLNPIKYFAEDTSYALENNYCLKDLNLSDCSLRYQTIHILSKILLKNKGLESLNISSNSIDDKAVAPFCKVLLKNFILKSLNLSRNKIKNVGAKALADALMYNQSIVELNLRENEIKDHGAEELCEATRVHSSILKLGLELNLVGEKFLNKLSKNLKANADSSAKIEPKRVKMQLASIRYNKNSLANIEVMKAQALKEKEEMIAKVAKQSEKLNEAKLQENKKFEEVHNEYLQLKQENFDLSKEIDKIELDRRVKFIQIDEHSCENEEKGWERMIENVDKEIVAFNQKCRI